MIHNLSMIGIYLLKLGVSFNNGFIYSNHDLSMIHDLSMTGIYLLKLGVSMIHDLFLLLVMK